MSKFKDVWYCEMDIEYENGRYYIAYDRWSEGRKGRFRRPISVYEAFRWMEDAGYFYDMESDGEILTREYQIGEFFPGYKVEDLLAMAYGKKLKGWWRVVSLVRRGLKRVFPRLNLERRRAIV